MDTLRLPSLLHLSPLSKLPSMTLKSILSSSPDKAAQQLLGSLILVTDEYGKETGGVLVETEAYFSYGDAASHYAKGKKSYNASMFKGGGTLYVHTNRHHTLVDVVTDNNGIPGAVLFRAIEPTVGLDTMRKRRNREDIHMLCNGPAKLCQALGVTIADDGLNILQKCRVSIVPPAELSAEHIIGKSKRRGISKNKEARLRFFINGNFFIS